jgi:hypothetical protein
MRSAITGMRYISPRSFEMRLHGRSSEIADWLPQAHKQRTGVTIHGPSLVQVMDEAQRWSPLTMIDTKARSARSG